MRLNGNEGSYGCLVFVVATSPTFIYSSLGYPAKEGVEGIMLSLMVLSDPIWSRSGYGLAIRNIFLGLRDTVRVAHTPIGGAMRGDILDYGGIPVYPSGNSEFSEDIIEDHYRDWNADALFLVKDLWPFREIPSKCMEWIPYAMIDHSPVHSQLIEKMQTAFKVVAPTKFAQEELKREGIDSTYIPLGVDTHVYRPHDKAECKRSVGALFNFKPSDFVVGIVKRNQPRCNIARMLEGFADFAKDKRDVHLILYTDIDGEVNLRDKIDKLKLKGLADWPDKYHYYVKGLTSEGMAWLYNAMNVLLYTSNDAFGLGGLEAQAVGTYVIGLSHAGLPENIVYGECVPVVEWFPAPVGIDWALPSRQNIADALQKRYEKSKEGGEMDESIRGVEFARSLDWAKIVEEKWKPFWKECEQELRPKICKEGISIW